MPSSPAFGQADLSNCERELIHLAGSIQPHGVLLALRRDDLVVLQASANCEAMLGVAAGALLGRPVARLGRDLAGQLQRAVPPLEGDDTCALQVRLGEDAIELDGLVRGDYEGTVHRHSAGGIVLELEPLAARAGGCETVSFEHEALTGHIAEAVKRLGAASNQGVLVDAVVQIFRDLTGYDRVMVYKFDPDGHGKIVAEARHPRLETLLGHHYPATDIPQRARELYVRNRVRVLVDVHYEPVPIEPRLQPHDGRELDMSMSYLRSMSPLHIQYLKNMGVNATLVVSLVRDGRLWGLVACHHDSPRNLRYPVRAACDLLGEVISTRLAAIENYAHAQVAILVRRLEQRLIEATSTEGDWRLALFRNPRTLLQPLEATGAALYYDGELLTAGEVPSTPELRALMPWIEAHRSDSVYSSSSIGRESDEFTSMTATASGVLAVQLSSSRPDYLVWFRKEQLQSVTWAGDPSKPVVRDDPLELSPRRSFAAWSEIVRGTATPWSGRELLLARAIGAALVDIIVQVHAVRLLIAEHQLERVRATIATANEPVVVLSAAGGAPFFNAAFCRLAGRDASTLAALLGGDADAVEVIFAERDTVRSMLSRLRTRAESWRGELHVAQPDFRQVPVAVRAEVVPGRDGATLGFIITLVDRTDNQRAVEALQHLEQSLSRAARMLSAPGIRGGAQDDEAIGAILANASMAAMDIADASGDPSVAPMLEELEVSTRRAASLYARIRAYGGGG